MHKSVTSDTSGTYKWANESSGAKRWYALQVRPCRERAVSSILRGMNQEEFLPLYKPRGTCDLAPLFPGYAFCKLDLVTGPKLYLVPWIIKIVGAGKAPLPVDAMEIEVIHRIEKCHLHFCPCPFGEPGDLVRIVDGPLKGIDGIYQREKGQRVIVSISLLQRAVAVAVETQWIAIVKTFRTRASA